MIAPIRFVSSILLLAVFIGFAQPINTGNVLDKKWDAVWISHPTAPLNAYGVFYFRKIVELGPIPNEFIIHVSADNRYELYVNEKRVLLGPAWGDLHHWRFESFDIAPYLVEGKNIIAARVVNFGHMRAVSQFSYKTGFVLQGDSEVESILNTNRETWEVIQDEAYQPLFINNQMVSGYYAANPADSFTAADHLWGWSTLENDYPWVRPGGVSNASNYGTPRHAGHYFNDQAPWLLVPRNIPLMEETRQSFTSIERTKNISPDPSFLQAGSSLTVPGNTRATILLDHERHTRGYPELYFSEGVGAKIKMTYAEGLYDREGNKGHRDQVEGKEIKGYYDVIYPDGEPGRSYRSLWHRVFRYVQLEVETREDPLVIDSLHFIYTAYPYQLNASLKTDNPDHEKLVALGWQTLRSGTGEIFEDGPYYEQLMYGGDARVASLVSLYMSGDERMTRNVIDLFDNSRMPEGLTFSRYPSNIVQINPQYSLCWIQIIHDYIKYTNDSDFTKPYLEGIAAVLGWHSRLLDDTGMLGVVPWLRHIENKSGSPQHPERGHSAQQSLFFALTLDMAADIFDHHHLHQRAEEYRSQSASIKSATFELCWDSERGLLGDTPEKDVFTKHANVLGILTDAIPMPDQQSVMTKILNDESLVQAYLFFHFYIFQALDKVGMGDQFADHIGLWEDMLDFGFTTMPEFKLESRSDCHAWSAHINYFFLTTLAGVKPEGFGSHRVTISPQLGKQLFLDAWVPLPDGLVGVQMDLRNRKKPMATISIPSGVEATFEWKGQSFDLVTGKQVIRLQ